MNIGPDGTVLRRGHWRSLELLENTIGVLETLDLYKRETTHPVYLRPTEGGLTAMSIDPEPRSMVGVGGASCTIEVVPPAREVVEAAGREFRAKVDAMSRE